VRVCYINVLQWIAAVELFLIFESNLKMFENLKLMFENSAAITWSFVVFILAG